MANLKKLQAQMEKLREEEDKTYSSVGRLFCEAVDVESVSEFRRYMKKRKSSLVHDYEKFKEHEANEQSETEAHASNN